MHSSLTVSNGLITVAFATASIAVSLLVFTPTHVEICALPLLLGCLAGRFQSLAIQGSPERFSKAASFTAVRNLLNASPAGRWSICLIWINGSIIFALLSAGPNVVNFESAIAAYSVFLLARELVCLPALRMLRARATS